MTAQDSPVRLLPRAAFAGLVVLLAVLLALPADAQQRRRIFIVDSYDRGYLWSQSTHRGVVRAMMDYGYLATEAQAGALLRDDGVSSDKVVIEKAWMDTKRRNSRRHLAEATRDIMARIADFKPDLVLLGDDNATNFIGNRLLDSEVPVVFWGVNGLPLKYGLVDSMDNPGHNVTGVWQSGYHKESLEFLSRLVPQARTFAILASDSVTARANVKQIQHLARGGKLPMRLVDTVITRSFSEFKARALDLASRVDAFFVVNHDTLVDENNRHVDMLTVGRWYLTNIRKPEASHEDQFVREGMLLTANDSGFNQGYRAFEMAYDILEQGLNPSRMRTVTPQRGPLMINRQRARMLGIAIEGADYIDQIVDEALALNE